MKHHTLLALAITSMATLPAHAAGYAYNADFSFLASGAPLDGYQGWTQSSPNDGGEFPWAFGADVDTDPTAATNFRPAAAVGGYYNTDLPVIGTDPPVTVSEFYASHALSFSSGMSFAMQFAMFDSEPFEYENVLVGAERNRFSFGFYNSSGVELLSVMFDPNVDYENPDPLTNYFDTWNVSTSSNGIPTGSATMAVFETSVYSLNLLMRPEAGNMKFSYSLVGTNTQSANGVLLGLGNEAITEMRLGITATDAGNGNGDQFGTNFLAVLGTAAVVPEPSSLLLCSITLGGLVLRRRRN